MPSQTRVATGVPGLDEVLDGGLPPRRLYLLQGAPGSGKTTIALQFLREGARRGERCLYISLSETAEEVRAVAASHGWSLDGVDLYEAVAGDLQDENTLFQPAEVELGERMSGILAEIERLKPSRVVLDSCSELRLLAQSPLRYRHQILALKRQLALNERTMLLVDNPLPNDPDVLLQSLAHGVICLEQVSPSFGASRRRLQITKLRGIAYSGGYHDLAIRTGGLRVFPRLVAAAHRGVPESGIVSSGVAELDALLGGGLERGTSALILGPAGCGKSSVASLYAVAAANRGEQVAMFGFDEARHATIARTRSMEVDLERHLNAGTITLQQVDPAELSPGEFSQAMRDEVEQRGARLVVIDSLNGYLNAMPEERFLNTQMHEMLAYLGQKGVLTLLIMAEHGLVGDRLDSPSDVSYLADSVILLRFFETGGGVRKALSVVKKRTGAHESTIRELKLGRGGVKLGQPLTEFRGVLAGVPVLGDGGSGGRA